jgi:hypothetical protein
MSVFGGALGFMAGGDVDTFPAGLSNLAGRWCPAFGVTKDGSNIISALTDLSGNGRHLDTAVGSPLYVASSNVNSKPAVRFSGSGMCLYRTFTVAQPNHIFIVANAATWTSADAFVVGEPNDSGLHAVKQSGTTPQVKNNAGAATGNTVSPTLGVRFLVASYFSGAASKQALNNDVAVSGTNIGTTGITQFQMGGENDGTNCVDADIAEVVLFSAECTGADLVSLKSYFNTRYVLW